MTLLTLKTQVRSGKLDTVIVALPDPFGRLVGKRFRAEVFLDSIAKHGTHAGPQVLRMVRQLRRLAQVHELLTSNVGVNVSGANTMLSGDVRVLHGFDAAVLRVLEGMRRKPGKLWMIDTVEDDTVFIGAYRGPMRADFIFRTWFAGCGARGPIIDVLGGLFSPTYS